MGLISRVSSRTYRYFHQIISKNSNKKSQNEGQRRSQRIPNHRPKTAICHGPQSSNLDSGTLFPFTRRLTKPPVKSSNATKFSKNTQVQSGIMVYGFDTTLDQLPKTCTENTEMSLWPVPSLKCTEIWLPDIELDLVPFKS